MQSKQRRVLLVYPHNFMDRDSGIATRYLDWAKYFKSREFRIDQLAMDRFVSKWEDRSASQFGGLIDKLFLSDFVWDRRGLLLTPISYLKKLAAWLSGYAYIDLPNYAFPRTKRRFRALLKANGYDVVLVSYAYWADLVVRPHAQRPRMVLEISDFLTLNLFDQKHGNVNIGRMIGEEIRRVGLFDEVLCISEEEMQFFSRFQPVPKYHFVPMFQERRKLLPMQEDHDVLFIASDNLHNQYGLKWFFDEVYPNLNRGVRILIVGRISSFAPHLPNVTRVAFVEDLAEAYSRARLAICPLLGGTGMKSKVIEAFAFGRPIVTTSKGVLGIPAGAVLGLAVEDEPRGFAAAIERMVTDPVHYAAQVTLGEDLFSRYFDKDVVYASLDRVFLN